MKFKWPTLKLPFRQSKRLLKELKYILGSGNIPHQAAFRSMNQVLEMSSARIPYVRSCNNLALYDCAGVLRRSIIG